ncbi:MAG: TatD family hydrolase, partial [Actinobacteria bacterium]|nr:TatD family hydrolase [Actinomycetota bacterium]
KNAPELRVAASQVPADRILAETDCPYLAPQAVRGKRNEPAYVTYTLGVLAQARGEDPDELGARIDANATACFRL